MSTFTFTANTSSTLATGYYGQVSYRDDIAAYQGSYAVSSTGNSSRVGIINFTGAGSVLKNTIISSITLELTATQSGYSDWFTKTLTIRKSNYQSIDKSISADKYVGDVLGYLYGAFYNNTNTVTLDDSNNTELFNALKSYLEAGNNTLVFYNGEKGDYSASEPWSLNYAGFSKIAITVNYDEHFVYYNNNGTAVKCAVYYNNNGTAIRCAAQAK